MQSLRYKIYLFLIFSEFIFLYPLYIVMFADAGLSALQISTLLIVWSIAILLAEIPSGALADKYSRRNLLVVAQVIRALGYAVWLFSPTFSGFLIGLVLWGVGHAFKSGAFEALVYDELKAIDAEKEYAKIMGKGESLALFFGLGSTLAATPVFIWWGYPGIVWGSIIAVVFSGVIALTLPNRPRSKELGALRYVKLIREASRIIIRTPTLFKTIIFSIFIGMLFRIFDEYTSLIIQQSGVITDWIPIVSAFVFMPVIIVGFVAYRFEKLKGMAFVGILALAGLALVATSLFGNVANLIFFSLFMLLLKLTQIIFGARIQHTITGNARATITSFNGFGVEVAAVGGFFLFGLATQFGDMRFALGFFGVLVLIATLIYLTSRSYRLRS